MERLSLHQFCKDNNLPKSSVHKRCGELGIPTAEGLALGDCDRLLQEFGRVKALPSAVEVEILDLGIPGLNGNLPGVLQQLSGTEAAPLAASEDVDNLIRIAHCLMSGMDAAKRQHEERVTELQLQGRKLAKTAEDLKFRLYEYQSDRRSLDAAERVAQADLQARKEMLAQMVNGQAPGGK